MNNSILIILTLVYVSLICQTWRLMIPLSLCSDTILSTISKSRTFKNIHKGCMTRLAFLMEISLCLLDNLRHLEEGMQSPQLSSSVLKCLFVRLSCMLWNWREWIGCLCGIPPKQYREEKFHVIYFSICISLKKSWSCFFKKNKKVISLWQMSYSLQYQLDPSCLCHILQDWS